MSTSVNTRAVSDSPEYRAAILRALWRDRLHIEPQALGLCPASVRARYQHTWQAAGILLGELGPFPQGLLTAWLGCPRGHVVFTNGTSHYHPGKVPWCDGSLESVCYLSLVDVLDDRRKVLVSLFQLWDHLLGCQCDPLGLWLSDGGGSDSGLAEVGRRFARLNALGYGHSALGALDAHGYFAQTMWLYVNDPRGLNALDPLAYELYRGTLLNDAFWPAR